MKTHLQPWLCFMGGTRRPSELADAFEIRDPHAFRGLPDGSVVELLISEDSDDHGHVIKDLLIWLEMHRKQLESVSAITRIVVLRHYIPKSHGSSCVNIPVELSGLLVKLHLELCITNVTAEDRFFHEDSEKRTGSAGTA